MTNFILSLCCRNKSQERNIKGYYQPSLGNQLSNKTLICAKAPQRKLERNPKKSMWEKEGALVCCQRMYVASTFTCCPPSPIEMWTFKFWEVLELSPPLETWALSWLLYFLILSSLLPNKIFFFFSTPPLIPSWNYFL